MLNYPLQIYNDVMIWYDVMMLKDQLVWWLDLGQYFNLVVIIF